MDDPRKKNKTLWHVVTEYISTPKLRSCSPWLRTVIHPKNDLRNIAEDWSLITA